MTPPLNLLRDRLRDVRTRSLLLEAAMLRQWAREYSDGHLAMDMEEIEDLLLEIRKATNAALHQAFTAARLAALEDGEYWEQLG